MFKGADPVERILLVVVVPLIQILTATLAANCGISSYNLMFGKHVGLVPNLYDVLQEMDWANRHINDIPGLNTEIHFSFECLVALLR